MSKYTVENQGDGCFTILGGNRHGGTLYLSVPESSLQDGFATPDLRPLCPMIRAAKTVEEAQAIVDGVVTVGPYTVDFRNPNSIRVSGWADGTYSTYSPCGPHYTHSFGDLQTKVSRATTATEIITILKESLVSTKKFTAVARGRGINISNGHRLGGGTSLYLGQGDAYEYAVPELKAVAKALDLAPSVAVAQAIIDAHVAEPPKEATFPVSVTVTKDVKVFLDDDGINVEIGDDYWYPDNGDTGYAGSPFAALFDLIDEESPETVAEAVEIIKEWNAK
jgi:hypothetical protein